MSPCDMKSISISELIKRIEGVDDPETQTDHRKCTSFPHSDVKYRSSRGPQLEKSKKINGLCLDCVRLHTDAQKGACRIPPS